MNIRRILLTAGTGVLLALSFPSFSLHFLAWVGLIPLFFALYDASIKQALAIGWIAGLVFFGGTVFWVTNSIHFYGNVPLLLSSLITFLLCAYLALYIALFSAAFVYARKRHPALMFVSAPAIWTMLELARTYVFTGFPWSLLGYAQYSVLPVIQIADITGVYGVSFLIVLVNAATAQAVFDRVRYPVLIAAVAVVSIVGYGYMRLGQPDGTRHLRISVVQGNIEQDKKWEPAYQSDVISTYRRLTASAIIDKPDLVIWPETAAPFYFGGTGPEHGALTKDLIEFVGRHRVPLVFGSPTYRIGPDRSVRLRNSAFLISAEGNVVAVYHKMHLVPFGEYVPLKKLLFFVEKMVQAIGDFEAGDNYTIMTVRNAKKEESRLATVICYEIIFPDLVRRFVAKGADVMTTITNDAWFGRTPAPYQHFSMAVLRAVENRVPIARAANTGVSGFIDSKGRIINASDIFTEAYLTNTITAGDTRTFYTKYGDIFSYACTFLALFIIIKRK